MNTTTAYNHLRRFQSKLHFIYHAARIHGKEHDWILAQLKEHIYDDAAWRRCPGWVRDNISERSSRALDDLYRPDLYPADLDRMLADARAGRDVKPAAYLRWQLRLDGRFVTSTDISEMPGDHMALWARVEGAHIWNHMPDKPFSPWGTA